MCKTRKATQVSIPSSKQTKTIPSSSFSSSSTISTAISSSSPLRTSLREDGPILYPFSELSSAPAVPLSSSTSRVTLRACDSVVLRRPFLSPNPSLLPSRLVALCRTHHRSVARLLGASLAADHIYLIYSYVPGATLAHCLRHPRNPNFTLLPTWLSRIQVASDLAQALDYIHNQSFTVHNMVKSSAVIVAEPDLRSKLCYFGAADLAGEVVASEDELNKSSVRIDSRLMKIEGTRGYMAPEVLAGSRISRKSDVFAFGVVLLEVISGREPLRYVIEKGDCYSVSIVETAREAVGAGRVRGWVDPRLGDSFPAEVAERVVRLALRCVEAEAGERPEMAWVAGKVSRMFLESKDWMEKIGVPSEMISVSFGPRRLTALADINSTGFNLTVLTMRVSWDLSDLSISVELVHASPTGD